MTRSHDGPRLSALAGAAAVALLASLSAASPANAACPPVPGDVNGDQDSSVTDVQCAILASLWSIAGEVEPTPTCLGGNPAAANANCDGATNVSDVVIIIALALDIGLAPDLDANANQCVDACEEPGAIQLKGARLVPMGAAELESPSFRLKGVTGEWTTTPAGEAQSPNHQVQIPAP